ncbi:Signal transduction histidine kinase [Haloplanus vescus]|uniref:histidine kinase n=1 Tax=Haloplanus vescus TaxID=555874 RepID=A0A1H3VWG0_9EURY|nr:HAMP domain-containing sensor histidine kinase [Haloplanus vescus]SDZ78398.1 Signal transduction histidine kinase [Haloplanus vescus]
MTGDSPAAIPLDAFSDPALAYAVERRDARITATNEAFERQFDEFATDTPVSTIFDRFTVRDTTGTEDPITHLVRGERVRLYFDREGDRGPFCARVLPDDEGGYLVFADLEQCPHYDGAPAVDQVSSVISHDLRNPLDVAKAHLQAARETGEQAHFESVADAHDRMERIIRDVLTLTRGDAVVDPSDTVSIETAATDAWQSVDTERATLELSDSLPAVTADPDHVRRVFENLFRNSVEHGSTDNRPQADDSVEHGAETEVDEAESDPTVTVGALEDGFYVTDTGPGIPPDEFDLVVEPGYSTREGGTGLGLAIVDRIVVAHGWDLTLTTAEDGGVRFEIRV